MYICLSKARKKKRKKDDKCQQPVMRFPANLWTICHYIQFSKTLADVLRYKNLPVKIKAEINNILAIHIKNIYNVDLQYILMKHVVMNNESCF